MYKEKPSLTEMGIIGKEKDILIDVSESCGYFFFILPPNLITGGFLKVSCNVESESMKMSFSYSVYLGENESDKRQNNILELSEK